MTTTPEPKNFQVGQVWLTRDGEKVRIICTDAKEDFPVVGLVEDTSLGWVGRWTREGETLKGWPNRYDLIREYKEPEYWWVNFYPGSQTDSYGSLEAAQIYRGPNCLFTIKVNRETGESEVVWRGGNV